MLIAAGVEETGKRRSAMEKMLDQDDIDSMFAAAREAAQEQFARRDQGEVGPL